MPNFSLLTNSPLDVKRTPTAGLLSPEREHPTINTAAFSSGAAYFFNGAQIGQKTLVMNGVVPVVASTELKPLQAGFSNQEITTPPVQPIRRSFEASMPLLRPPVS